MVLHNVAWKFPSQVAKTYRSGVYVQCPFERENCRECETLFLSKLITPVYVS